MSGDLHVDPGVLASLRAGLRTVEDRLSATCRQLGSFEGLSVGARPIFDELTEFAADWEYGLHRIGRGCAEAVEALDGIAAAFTDVDQRLSRLLATTPCGTEQPVPEFRDGGSRLPEFRDASSPPAFRDASGTPEPESGVPAAPLPGSLPPGALPPLLADPLASPQGRPPGQGDRQ